MYITFILKLYKHLNIKYTRTINDSHMFDAQIPETIGNLTNLEKL